MSERKKWLPFFGNLMHQFSSNRYRTFACPLIMEGGHRIFVSVKLPLNVPIPEKLNLSLNFVTQPVRKD